MKEVKLSPTELKKIVDEGTKLGNGHFGTVFTYQDRLIKLDNRLYYLLRTYLGNDVRSKIEKYYFQNGVANFNNRSQIEMLAKKQKNITLTKLPTGIVTLKDVDPKIWGVSPGILLPYHKNHQNLNTLNPKDYKKVLIILKKLLLAVRELANNQIAQEDFGQLTKEMKRRDYNILYQNDTPQIIDMSGLMVRVGDNFSDADLMYRSLGEVVLDFYKINKIDSPYQAYDIDSENQIEFLLKEFEKETRSK